MGGGKIGVLKFKGESVKKVIIGFLMISLSLNAYVINGQDRDGDTIIYYLKCSDGSLPTISKNTTINRFFPGNTSSMDKAAYTVCKKRSKSEKIKTFKKYCLVFNKRFGSWGIDDALISKSSYQTTDAMFSIGSEKGFLLGKKSSFTVLDYYPPYKVSVDEHGHYIDSKSTGKYTKVLIDGYYKIKDKHNKIVYMRKNCSY